MKLMACPRLHPQSDHIINKHTHTQQVKNLYVIIYINYGFVLQFQSTYQNVYIIPIWLCWL